MKKYHKILLVLSCATILVTAGIIISLNVIDRNRTKAMISVILRILRQHQREGF